VVGIDADAPQSIYEHRNFKGGRWTLDYMPNPGKGHMFLPEKFLERAAKARIDAVTGAGPIVRPGGEHKRNKVNCVVAVADNTALIQPKAAADSTALDTFCPAAC
jgi:DhnA family fructose-bisphosphate aldolase class Ia